MKLVNPAGRLEAKLLRVTYFVELSTDPTDVAPVATLGA